MATSSGSVPALGNLRIAAPEDVLRIGLVATAGFYYSPVFRWQRPYHKDYPDDTILSYRSQFQSTIQSDDFIVLVAEAAYKLDENTKTAALIPAENGWQPPEEGERVIVGVASIKLEPSSRHKRRFKRKDGTRPELPEDLGRDLNRKHYDSWLSLAGGIKEKYCQGDSVISMLVVHPAYWGRGFGIELCRWAVELSKFDNVKQCVSAAGMSHRLYSKVGFEEVCLISAPGDEDDAEGVSTHLMEYRPSKKQEGL